VGAYEIAEDGCWNWRGSPLNGAAPYRFIYEYEAGYALPTGQHLHHTCHNRMCINPMHLMSVTRDMHNKIHGKLRRGKIRHTDEQRAALSRLKTEWWAQRTPEERLAMSDARVKTRARNKLLREAA
jgi:hypothetical protein